MSRFLYNDGRGSPARFLCPTERRERRQRAARDAGGSHHVRLTGRVRRAGRRGALGERGTRRAREFVCMTCGHVGWSSHRDLAPGGSHSRGGARLELGGV